MLRIFRQYYPVRNIFFVLGEGFVIFSSIVLASWLYLGLRPIPFDSWLYSKALFITFVFQAALYYNDLYDLKITDTLFELSIRLLQALGAAAIFMGIICYFFPKAIVGHWVFLLSLGLIILLIVSWRYGYSIVLYRGLFNQKIILLGSGSLSQNIISEIKGKKDCGYRVSLVVRDDGGSHELKAQDDGGVPLRYGYEGLCDLARELEVQKVVVAIWERRGKFPTNELLKCRMEGIEVLDGNSFYEMLAGKLIVEHTNPGWLIFSDGFHRPAFTRMVKRVLDIVLSLMLLIVSSPLLILVGVLIKIDSRGPVIFSQDRVGKSRRKYMVHKFRSMVQDAEKETGPVWAGEDDVRVTRVGRLIRKLRIDELPQLWNVLKGEMSFVGPRPEREYFVSQLEEIIPYYGVRFSIKPGVTGWAQVSYGYGASVEDAVEKLNYDLFYIKNMSIFMDLLIVLRTIKIVVFGKGAR